MQIGATAKQVARERRQTVGQVDFLQVATVAEGRRADFRHAVGQAEAVD